MGYMPGGFVSLAQPTESFGILNADHVIGPQKGDALARGRRIVDRVKARMLCQVPVLVTIGLIPVQIRIPQIAVGVEPVAYEFVEVGDVMRIIGSGGKDGAGHEPPAGQTEYAMA